MRFSSLVKHSLRRVGFEVARYGLQTSPDAQLAQILKYFGTDLVLDVGAHEGQYAKRLRALGYRGRIVSFEPQSEVYTRLLAASRNDPAWEVAPRAAIGNLDGELTINVSAHSLSSSILEMLPLHEEAAPGSGIIGAERVPVKLLDQLASPYFNDPQSTLLKIDAQGYERQILEGANGVLKRTRLIQIELSFAPLYSGQPLFDEMRQKLLKLGFSLYALFPGYVHKRTGETLQVDGVFIQHSRCDSQNQK